MNFLKIKLQFWNVFNEFRSNHSNDLGFYYVSDCVQFRVIFSNYKNTEVISTFLKKIENQIKDFCDRNVLPIEFYPQVTLYMTSIDHQSEYYNLRWNIVFVKLIINKKNKYSFILLIYSSFISKKCV